MEFIQNCGIFQSEERFDPIIIVQFYNIENVSLQKQYFIICKGAFDKSPLDICRVSKPAKLQNKLSNTETPQKIRSKWFAPIFPVEQLKHLLDHDNHEMRDKFRDFISEPVMVPRYNISLEEERELALRRLQRICDNDFISVLDFWNNPLRIFAAHELAAIIDPAMTTKMTVQVSKQHKQRKIFNITI